MHSDLIVASQNKAEDKEAVVDKVCQQENKNENFFVRLQFLL